MARKEPPAVTIQDVGLVVSAALRRASVSPSIHGYHPMEKQLKFHTSCATGRAYMGGNRSGKTVGGGAEMVMWVTGKHPYRPVPTPPIRARAVGVDFDHGVEKILKPEVARWMPPSELINGSWEDSYSKEFKTLNLANGSSLEFMSYDQDVDKFAGTSRHCIWFDEEPPIEIFDECMMRLVDTGGSWWLTMTPVEGMTWVYDRVYIPGSTGVDQNIEVVTTSSDENIYVNKTVLDALMSGMSDDDRKARREGKFVQFGGLIYGDVLTKENVVDDIYTTEFWPKVRKDWLHFQSMDHGFNNPTAWLWLAVNTDGKILVYDEYYRNREIVARHAEEVKNRNALLRVAPVVMVGDPSIRNTDPITGTSVQLEYQEHGLTILPGNNDVAAGIQMVARMLQQNQLLVTRRCRMLLWELQRYRWATWASKKTQHNKNVRDEPNKKDDHACDALRYAIASRQSLEPLSSVTPTNILGGSVALDPSGERRDLELAEWEDERNFDYTLGSEW